jgi:hypothetical protein
MSATVQPYDPSDSPGPITSVLERFRPHRGGPATPGRRQIEAERYAVVLVPPEAAGELGHDREDTGLKLYRDGDWNCDLASLYEATLLIAEECGVPVTLVEHHADLTYWTARLHEPAGTP